MTRKKRKNSITEVAGPGYELINLELIAGDGCYAVFQYPPYSVDKARADEMGEHALLSARLSTQNVAAEKFIQSLNQKLEAVMGKGDATLKPEAEAIMSQIHQERASIIANVKMIEADFARITSHFMLQAFDRWNIKDQSGKTITMPDNIDLFEALDISNRLRKKLLKESIQMYEDDDAEKKD